MLGAQVFCRFRGPLVLLNAAAGADICGADITITYDLRLSSNGGGIRGGARLIELIQSLLLIFMLQKRTAAITLTL
jgi:hypothetical protein